VKGTSKECGKKKRGKEMRVRKGQGFGINGESYGVGLSWVGMYLLAVPALPASRVRSLITKRRLLASCPSVRLST
jgi:hypothetical protein